MAERVNGGANLGILGERFWSKVDRGDGPDACWQWTGGTTTAGRGRFYFNGRLVYPYRLTCELTHGPAPSAAHVARHVVCRNPACCNPAHLAWGTARDNARDMVSDGTCNLVNNPEARFDWRLAQELARQSRELRAIAREV